LRLSPADSKICSLLDEHTSLRRWNRLGFFSNFFQVQMQWWSTTTAGAARRTYVSSILTTGKSNAGAKWAVSPVGPASEEKLLSLIETANDRHTQLRVEVGMEVENSGCRHCLVKSLPCGRCLLGLCLLLMVIQWLSRS